VVPVRTRRGIHRWSAVLAVAAVAALSFAGSSSALIGGTRPAEESVTVTIPRTNITGARWIPLMTYPTSGATQYFDLAQFSGDFGLRAISQEEGLHCDLIVGSPWRTVGSLDQSGDGQLLPTTSYKFSSLQIVGTFSALRGDTLALYCRTSRASDAILQNGHVVLTRLTSEAGGPAIPAAPVALNAAGQYEPNIPYAGRIVAVGVDPFNAATVVAASELGGLFQSTDSGTSWHHLDGLPPHYMTDVVYSPVVSGLVFATSYGDAKSPPRHGLWRSSNNGQTWTPVALTSTCGSTQAGAITVRPGTADVFVSTDCGLQVSHNSGATWSAALDPQGQELGFLGSSTVAAGNIVDVCGVASNGAIHRRSIDDGAHFGDAHLLSSDAWACFGHHDRIATSPRESNVLFAALAGPTLVESIDSGVTWNPVPISGNRWNRPPFVITHLPVDGDPNHFDVYWSDGNGLARQTCTSGGTGLRCNANAWTGIDPGHPDPADIAFVPAGDNCPDYISSDGGLAKMLSVSGGCANGFQMLGTGAAGLAALQIRQVTGQIHPGSTDLFFATQDNELWASADNGTTWQQGQDVDEGMGITLPRKTSAPTDMAAFPCNCWGPPPNPYRYDAYIQHQQLWTPPEVRIVTDGHVTNGSTTLTSATANFGAADVGKALSGGGGHLAGGARIATVVNSTTIQMTLAATGTSTTEGVIIGTQGFPSVIAPNVWVQTAERAEGTRIYVSTDDARTWRMVPGLVLPGPNIDFPQVTGPADDPTVYIPVARSTGTGLVRVDHVLSQSPTMANADNGLSLGAFSNIGYPQVVLGSDPKNPQHLIAADITSRTMKVTWNGGASWNTNTSLTNLVTANGQFSFDGYSSGPEARVIAFDPSDGRRILIGTEDLGVFQSTDGGFTWSVLAGTQHVPDVSSFFFDESRHDVMTATEARGLWILTTNS
jgi:hypothetical protein